MGCMIELGELEKSWQEFDKRKVRVYAISIEDQKAAEATQADFPHLSIVSDAKRKLVDAFAALDPGHAPDGGDTAVSTTILVDGKGTIRWVYRPDRAMTQLTPPELLAAVDREMPAQ
jgi:peroxiredoxin